MPSDIVGLTRHPDFQSLPWQKRADLLVEGSPEFAAASPEDQQRLMVEMKNQPWWKPGAPPAEEEKPPEKMGMGEQFLKGIRSGAEGVNLGLAQSANALTGNRLLDPQRLNEMEQERRAKADQFKSARGGEAGFGNLGSWGELLMESAAMAALPALRATTIPRAIASGAIVGGQAGALAPRVEGESRLGAAAMGAGAGAVLGGAAKGAIKGIQAVPGILRKGEEAINRKIDKIFDTGLKELERGENKQIANDLGKVASYKSSEVGDIKDIVAKERKRIHATEVLYKLRDEVQLVDEYGEKVAHKTPKTHFEFLHYINDAKDKLFKKYDLPRAEAEAAGLIIKPKGVVNHLQSVIDNSDNAYTTAQTKYAKGLLEDFANLDESGRVESLKDFTPSSAQKRIAGYNKKLADYYSSKDVGFTDNASIHKDVLDIFRVELVDTINRVDPKYGDIRKDWGAISELEKDAVKSYMKYVKKKDVDHGLDFLASEQVLYAIAKGNPNYLLPAMGTMGMKAIGRRIKNPDRAVRRIFAASEKKLGDQKYSTAPEVITPEPLKLKQLPEPPIKQSGQASPPPTQGMPQTEIDAAKTKLNTSPQTIVSKVKTPAKNREASIKMSSLEELEKEFPGASISDLLKMVRGELSGRQK